MLLAPRHGFVYLAMPKTGSTAIESAFRRHSQGILRGAPLLRHADYTSFQRFLQPFLASAGFHRDSYEVVCAFRDPIDWLASWWRYRLRERLADPSAQRHHKYAGGVSFERFARAYMEGGDSFVAEPFVAEPFVAGVGRPYEFVRSVPGEVGVDRIFRYDSLDLLVEFLSEKVGREVKVNRKNVSPESKVALDETCKRELLEFFAAEYRIYEGAIGR